MSCQRFRLFCWLYRLGSGDARAPAAPPAYLSSHEVGATPYNPRRQPGNRIRFDASGRSELARVVVRWMPTGLWPCPTRPQC
jgi:hypothetical protein